MVLVNVVDRNCLGLVVGLLSRRGLTSGTDRWFGLASEVFEPDCMHWFRLITMVEVVEVLHLAESGLDDDALVEGVLPLQVLDGGCSVLDVVGGRRGGWHVETRPR